MISPGDGVALAGVCGVAIAGILRFVPNKTGNGGVSEKVCKLRYGTLKEDIKEMKDDIKEILKTIKI